MIRRIMFREIHQQFRDYKVIVLMTLLPIVIIFVMGLIFNSVFSGSVTLAEIRVGTVNTQILDALEMDLVVFDHLDDALLELRNGQLSAVLVEDDGLTLYKNEGFSKEGSVVESMVSNLNTSRQIGKVIHVKESTSVEIREMTDNISATNYFGIAMCMLFVFYGIPMQITSVVKEKTQGTLYRMLQAVSPFSILLGKYLGQFVVASFQMTTVLLVSYGIFGVNWGNVLVSWLLMESLVSISVAFGMLIGSIARREERAMGLIHVLIVFFAFFGGAYTPIDLIPLIRDYGKFLSPIWWSNVGLMDSIYKLDYNYFYQSMTINLLLGGLLLMMALFVSKRRKHYA